MIIRYQGGQNSLTEILGVLSSKNVYLIVFIVSHCAPLLSIINKICLFHVSHYSLCPEVGQGSAEQQWRGKRAACLLPRTHWLESSRLWPGTSLNLTEPVGALAHWSHGLAVNWGCFSIQPPWWALPRLRLHQPSTAAPCAYGDTAPPPQHAAVTSLRERQQGTDVRHLQWAS